MQGVLAAEERTGSEVFLLVSASLTRSVVSSGLKYLLAEDAMGPESLTEKLSSAGAGPEIFVPAGRFGAVPGITAAAGPEISLKGKFWSGDMSSAEGSSAEEAERTGTGFVPLVSELRLKFTSAGAVTEVVMSAGRFCGWDKV